MMIDWLMEEGGPAIRYRTVTELGGIGENPAVLEDLLLQSPLTQAWLHRITRDTSFNAIHGSKHTCFENVLGKLAQLGCRSGMPVLDRPTQYFREWLTREPQMLTDRLYSRVIVAAFLLQAGYRDDPMVRHIAQRRLEILSAFCRYQRYDFYVDPVDFPAIPKAYRDYPLVDPALYTEGDMPLPNVYDLYILANYPADVRSEAVQEQIDTVIDYIFQDDYQNLPQGYGIGLFGPRRYWVIGWSLHLPGYFEFTLDDHAIPRLIRGALLLAHFPTARKHRWFQNVLNHLETFRTERDTYLFPREYLPEAPSGYWINGNFMGLEENRRIEHAIELESTFWMLKLRQTIQE